MHRHVAADLRKVNTPFHLFPYISSETDGGCCDDKEEPGPVREQQVQQVQ